MSDLIDRQVAIDLLKRWSGGYSYIEYDTESAIYDFERLPSAQPERKKGEWIFHGTAWKNEYRECSICKCYFKADMPRNSFCPNCGADMRGDTE